MEAFVANYLAETFATVAVGIFGYLVRHYLKSITDAVAALRLEFAKRDGRLDALQKEIHTNTIQLAGLTSELRALWRIIDGAHLRASDVLGGE